MSGQLTISRSPARLQAANLLLGMLPGVKRIAGLPDLASLHEISRQRAALTDFGSPGYLPGLEVLLDSLNREVDLSPLGRMVIRRAIIGYLVNRLQIEQVMHHDATIAQEPIERPLFIVGLSRTGTTLLHNLLTLAPAHRAPRVWQLMQPAPGVDPNGPEAQMRIRKAERQLFLLNTLVPQLKTVHPIRARDIEECYPFLNHTFTSPAFIMHYGVPAYANWLSKREPGEAEWVYQEYRRQLQILQQGRPRARWVLKSAAHLMWLDSLLQVFPDAAIIQTHRDLQETLPSLCSMTACFRYLVNGNVNLRQLGPECLKQVRTVLSRARLSREGRSPCRFIDIEFTELVRDPVEVVRGIHDRLELGWDSASDERLHLWVSRHPPHPHGIHRYSLEQFGLTSDEIDTINPL
ncbi:sulfotransferase [Gemmatimonadota bacterium]